MNKPLSSPASAADWLAAHGDALYRHAYARLRDAMAAEDAVQETLLAALKGHQRFAGRSSERTWLIGILNNKVVDLLRRQGRERSLSQADISEEQLEELLFAADGHWRHPPAAWGDPADILERESFWEALVRCLDALPPRHAQAFTLCEIDGLMGAEAGKVLGMTATNLWVVLHRVRLRLRECLDNAGVRGTKEEN